MEHIPAHAYKLASPCCSPWRDQWPWSLTQLNLPRRNRHQAHLLWKPSRNCWRVINQVLYFVFLCGDHLLHPKNTAVSPSTKENYKKIKQELLKGHKPGVVLCLPVWQSLIASKNTAVFSSAKENHKEIKQELLKGRKPGPYFVLLTVTYCNLQNHSCTPQHEGKPQD